MTIFKRLLPLLLLLVFLLPSSSALAATPAPGWTIDSFAKPTSFSSTHNAKCLEELGSNGAGEEHFSERLSCDSYKVSATNSGSRPTEGPITLTDTVPAGLTVQKIAFVWEGAGAKESPFGFINLAEFGLCTPIATQPLECHFPLALAPDEELRMVLYVTLNSGVAGDLTNTTSVSGGAGSRPATRAQSNPVDAKVPFGFSSVSALSASLDGTPDTQAGSHPYELTMRFDLNNEVRFAPQDETRNTSIQDVRDLAVDLPLGMVGTALAAPTCTFAQLSSQEHCPSDTVVGHLTTEPPGAASVEGPIYNMVPEHGVATEFGFFDGVKGAHVLYVRVVPTPSGYVLRTTSPEIPQIDLTDLTATLYGDPAAKQEEIATQEGKEVGGMTPVPLLTNPSDCSGRALVTSTHADSWPSPGRVSSDGTPDFSDPSWASAASESPAVTGCNQLQFNPSLSVQPETTAADSPTGLQFDLKVPQSQPVGALATPPLRDAVVTLPVGMTVNPSSAGWLEACSESQIGWLRGSLSNFTPAEPACPPASRLGSVELTTPALPGTLVGSVYLANQYENPFGSLLAGYIVIDDPTTGVVVKIPGELKADPSTGQITGVFKENPQLPFSDLKLHFFGGNRGELATPQSCGTFTTTSDLAPWSAPESGPDATPYSSYVINAGCTRGFAPSFLAGTVNSQAAAFSPFTLTLTRSDADQHLSGLTVTMPRGLLGSLKSVSQCPEPQASKGQCSTTSQIGEASAAAGVGTPYWVSGGRVYLTGPYNGGPFGLSIIVPAVAGPFNLGNVVVRSSIRIDPTTAQITVVSDPLPEMINSVEGLHSGIPADLRAVDVRINRPGFTFNPTNCSPLSVTGTVSGIQGASTAISSPFQAGNCGALAFGPQFSASTKAKTSKANGASLHVNISYRKPGEANIAKVDVEIPKILPTRLTTLQKACLEAQFNANPAGCPAPSVIATAIVRTPLLSTPLTGPVYFVSHGAAAFPDVEMVLQGEGVRLVVDGKTQIKNGVTFAHFDTVPDAPFTSFEFNAPTGPFSIFAANGNLCQNDVGLHLKITGQNGAVLNQKLPVAVEGCPNALTVISHKIKHRSVTLKVAVPAAGKLTASGNGLTKVSNSSKGRGIITLTLKARRRGKLNTKVRLSFAPGKGRTLTVTVAAVTLRG